MFRPDFPFTIGLSLNGHQGTRVEAYGVTLMVDGFMEPVSMDHCSGVTLYGPDDRPSAQALQPRPDRKL